MTMNQPTLQPTNKVTAAGAGGAASVLLVYILGLFNINLPAEVASALTVLIATASGYLRKESI